MKPLVFYEHYGLLKCDLMTCSISLECCEYRERGMYPECENCKINNKIEEVNK